MSNPTTHTDLFNGSAPGWSITGPERYDSGLWLEEAETNYCTNPSAESGTTGWSAVNGAITQTAVNPQFGSNEFRWERDSTAGAGQMIAGPGNRPSVTAGEVWTVATKVEGTPGLTLRLNLAWHNAGGSFLSESGIDFVLSATSTWVVTTATAPANAASLRPSLQHVATGTVGDVWRSDGWMFAKKAYLTSYTDTTRAASSASVTIDEPVSVACWYREAYSGAKQFAYLDTLGQLGTYGSIAYAAGDLTISTSRNLVIGPFAAFDRALTANEQANLRSTQNWTSKTVFGPNPYTTYQMRPY